MAKKIEKLQTNGEGITLYIGKKSLSVTRDSLQVTNEYGNSISYNIEQHSFEELWSQLWQFVKDSQH